MDVLNLDSLAPAKTQTLVLDGVTHTLKSMSVEDFIVATREAKQLEAVKDDPVAWVESTVRFITRSFPTLDEARVRKLDMAEMWLITKFINGELEAEAAKAAPEGDGAGKPEAKTTAP